MSFTIVTDSAANLPRSVLREHNITSIPFVAYFNGEEFVYEDPESFDDVSYYTAIRDGATFSSSQINPDRYIEYFTPILEAGKDVLFVGVSSGVSGSFNSARIAMEELLEKFPERTIRLVDSLSAALGEGLIVLQAVLCRARGLTLENTARHLEEIRTRVYHLLSVDDMAHLGRSGRIPSIIGTLGSALNIKPLLKGSDEGKIVLSGKARGRKKLLQAMADKYAQLVHNAHENIVGISHAGCPDDANTLAELIREKAEPKELILTKHEPATGGHIGPGALAIFFFGAEGVRKQ